MSLSSLADLQTIYRLCAVICRPHLLLDVLLVILRSHDHDGRTGHSLLDACGTQLDTYRARDGLVVDILALHLEMKDACVKCSA